MPVLNALRHRHWLTRCVLVWWLAFMGVAVASPLWRAPATTAVCSVSGWHWVVADSAASDAAPAVGMECPLCLPVLSSPPPLRTAWAAHPLPEGPSLPILRAIAPPSPGSGAPLPPRGPPRFA